MTPAEWITEKFRAWRVSERGIELLVPTGDCLEGRRTPDEGCLHARCDSVRLTELPEGRAAVVTCLERSDTPASRKLAAMGILPGAEVRTVQRRPAWIVEVGHSEFALDVEMAGRIRVRDAG